MASKTTTEFVTYDDIIAKREAKIPIFMVDIVIASRRKRSVNVEKYGIYYADIDLDGNKTPLQISPTRTSSNIYDAGLSQQDLKDLKQNKYKKDQKTPNAVIIQTTGDILDESEDEIANRATQMVKENAPDVDLKKHERLVKQEINMIHDKKKLTQAMIAIDDYFRRWSKSRKTKAELAKYMQFESPKDAKYIGPIQRERKLSEEEKIELAKLMDNELKTEDEDEDEDEDLKRKITIARIKMHLTINPDTELVVLDGSKAAGSPIIRFQIGLHPITKNLYVDLKDISSGKTKKDKRTGDPIYQTATVTKISGDVNITEVVNYDSIAKFMPANSMFVGMVELRLTISPTGISLKLSLTNQLYVKPGQFKRKVIQVSTGMVNKLADIEAFEDAVDQDKSVPETNTNTNTNININEDSSDEYSDHNEIEIGGY